MIDVSTADWERFQALAGRVGLSAERVSALRRRIESNPQRPGSPYILLLGRPDSGIEFLLARWISPDAADELKKAGERPLVLGPSPGGVQPKLGSWPTFKTSKVADGHLLALRALGRPGADVLAQLASLGHIDQVVLVTRLGQALSEKERDLAASAAGLASTARVLLVGYPGEEVTDADLAELGAIAMTRMREAGFRGGRFLGAGVWFPNAEAGRLGIVADLNKFIAVDAIASAAGREEMFRRGFADLLGEVRQLAEQNPEPPRPPIEPEERERLTREFSRYLAELGREMTRAAQSGRIADTEGLRAYARDAIRGWGAYTSVEGHWMKYVEKLRPGTRAALLSEVDAALPLVEFEPGVEAKPASPQASLVPAGFVDRATAEAKRVGLGLVVGIAAYLTVSHLLADPALVGEGKPLAGLPSFLVALLGYAGLLVGGLLGYAAGRRFFKPPFLPREGEGGLGSGEGRSAQVHGWQQAEWKLQNWFVGYINVPSVSPADECDAWAGRLGIGGEGR